VLFPIRKESAVLISKTTSQMKRIPRGGEYKVTTVDIARIIARMPPRLAVLFSGKF
jgi:hypothetical protein